MNIAWRWDASAIMSNQRYKPGRVPPKGGEGETWWAVVNRGITQWDPQKTRAVRDRINNNNNNNTNNEHDRNESVREATAGRKANLELAINPNRTHAEEPNQPACGVCGKRVSRTHGMRAMSEQGNQGVRVRGIENAMQRRGAVCENCKHKIRALRSKHRCHCKDGDPDPNPNQNRPQLNPTREGGEVRRGECAQSYGDDTAKARARGARKWKTFNRMLPRFAKRKPAGKRGEGA